jgi:hypothetical protein
VTVSCAPVAADIDLEQLGRELGVLQLYERLEPYFHGNADDDAPGADLVCGPKTEPLGSPVVRYSSRALAFIPGFSPASRDSGIAGCAV